MTSKIRQNRQTGIKIDEARVGPVNSKFPKRFYTTKSHCSPSASAWRELPASCRTGT